MQNNIHIARSNVIENEMSRNVRIYFLIYKKHSLYFFKRLCRQILLNKVFDALIKRHIIPRPFLNTIRFHDVWCNFSTFPNNSLKVLEFLYIIAVSCCTQHIAFKSFEGSRPNKQSGKVFYTSRFLSLILKHKSTFESSKFRFSV